MFRLTRNYSIASFLGIALVAIALGVLYRSTAMRSLIEQQAQSDVVLAQSLSNSLWLHYAPFIARAANLPATELGEQPEISQLRKEVSRQLQDLRVAKLKIYNDRGLTIYSTEPAEIGENQSDNPSFRAARSGATVSTIVSRDHFASPLHSAEDRHLMSSYIPVRRAPAGAVEGVIEIYTDVTSLMKKIEQTRNTILSSVVFLLLLLYVFLLTIVRRADRIIRAHENAERRAQAEQMHYMAYHDPLTGLPNRALFKDRFQHAAALALRGDTPLGIMFIDIDRFKVINDSLGHEGGDSVLIEAAKRIRSCLRASDTACRIGGDEFMVVLERLPSNEQAAQAAERLIQELAKPMIVGNREVIVTASIGIAVFPGATQDIQRLLKDADAAMHEAKDSGRNAYVFYTKEMEARAQESLEYELDLRQALRNREFLVYYQPRVNIATGAIVGAEALLRWQHPKRGLVMPDAFIPLLEDTGLVISVGEWVLQQACRQCRRWRDAGHAALTVSVNLSMKQFRARSLADDVRRALEETGLPPDALELEITETVLVGDAEEALRLMHELKSIGVRLSIDDFGTGYSSLNYLRRFPIDLLKIDGSFIREVTRNRGDAAITTTIAVMAKSLRLGLLAEGVETSDQARFLKTIGCHEMQGLLFAGAVSVDEFGPMLSTLDPIQLAGFNAPGTNGSGASSARA